MGKLTESEYQVKLNEVSKVMKEANTLSSLDDKKTLFCEALPVLAETIGFKLDDDRHDVDLWMHLIKTVFHLDRNIDNDALYYAALLHDIGKSVKDTKEYVENYDNPVHMTSHNLKSLDMLSSELYRHFRDLASYRELEYLIEYHSDKVVFDIDYVRKHYYLKVGLNNFKDLMSLKIADAKARNSNDNDNELINICERLKGKEGENLWQQVDTEYKKIRAKMPGVRLYPVRYDEIDCSRPDRLCTAVTLDDYDWMHYTLDIGFETINQGALAIRMEMDGSINCYMYVTQRKDDVIYRYQYVFGIDIFNKYMTEFLLKHIKSYNDTYAFNGQDVAIKFFNEVLARGEIELGVRNIDYKCCYGGVGKNIWEKPGN